MPEKLIDLFRDGLQEGWSEELKCLILEQSLPRDTLCDLAQSCAQFHIQSPLDYLSILRKLITTASLCKLSQRDESDLFCILRLSLKEVLKQGYWDTFHLAQALSELASKVFNLQTDTSLLCDRPLIESAHFLDGSIPHPLMSAELGVIMLCLSLMDKNQKTLKTLCELGRFHLKTLDARGFTYRGLWMREEDFNLVSLLSLNYLFFTACFQISLDPKMDVAARSQLRQLQGMEPSLLKEIPQFTMLLALALGPLLKQQIEPCVETLDQDDHEYLMTYEHPEFSIAATLIGVGTGVGSYHKKEMGIASFGPHHLPLGDMSRFGIYRTFAKESVGDILTHRDGGEVHFCGWTKLVASTPPRHVPSHVFTVAESAQWMHLDVQTQEAACFVKVKFYLNTQEPLAFTFFVSAEAVEVESQTFFPNTLARYEGISQKILFRNKSESFAIRPLNGGEMQIIPLSGSHFFWGSDFLVAFPITSPLATYSWEIK